ncbi:MAG TPA: NAD(P)H-hydrate dehydratase, partial [Sphingomonadales bacterium]|nr:NAD(P)H-hydrate dehydratase [Sphingomonadales bacterium]
MRRCERAAFRAGLPSYSIMEKAGAAVAAEILKRKKRGRALILIGPGNNGGDGWVVARLLTARGWDVVCAALTAPSRLKGDALRAYQNFGGKAAPFPKKLRGFRVIVDALFGTGLMRPVTGRAANWIKAANRTRALRIAVDIPSGISSDTGRVLGVAFQADLTVTFFRKKRGHVLDGGLECSGEVVMAPIGIANKYLKMKTLRTFENHPALWRKKLPRLSAASHKHNRGHTLVFGGEAPMSGAARMAAYAALRVGSGLVTTLVPEKALTAYAQKQMALMGKGFSSLADVEKTVSSRRFTAFVIGPGNGVGEGTRGRVLAVLKTGKPTVLDADALTSFKENPDALFRALHARVVLTPHAGEFARLFPGLDPAKDKIEAARAAAKRAGCVVLLKGADTVVAAPKGTAVVNIHASPYLATAGSGDVLAGVIGGLMAQGVRPLEAACAGAWLQGEAGLQLG